MIVLITVRELCPISRRMETFVSHGIDTQTDRVVVMPNDKPQALGAVLDHDLGEWVLP